MNFQYDPNVFESALNCSNKAVLALEDAEKHINNISNSKIPVKFSGTTTLLGTLGNIKTISESVALMPNKLYKMKTEVESAIAEGRDLSNDITYNTVEEFGTIEKVGATVVMAGSKIVEGFASGIEEMGDGILSIIGWGAGLLGAKDFQDSIGDYIEKEHVGDWFLKQYEIGMLSGVNDASYMKHDSTAAKIFKAAGVATSYVVTAALTGGGTVVAMTTAGLGGLGSGTADGLRQGLDYNAAFGKGVIRGTANAAIAGVADVAAKAAAPYIEKAVISAKNGLRGTFNASDDVVRAAVSSGDDVSKALVSSTDDVTRAAASSTDDMGKAAVSAADDAGRAATSASKGTAESFDDVLNNARNGKYASKSEAMRAITDANGGVPPVDGSEAHRALGDVFDVMNGRGGSAVGKTVPYESNAVKTVASASDDATRTIAEGTKTAVTDPARLLPAGTNAAITDPARLLTAGTNAAITDPARLLTSGTSVASAGAASGFTEAAVKIAIQTPYQIHNELNKPPIEDIPVNAVPPSDVPSDDVPSDDVPSGDVPSGNVPSGDVPSGDVPSGDVPSGDVPPTRNEPSDSNNKEEIKEPPKNTGISNVTNNYYTNSNNKNQSSSIKNEDSIEFSSDLKIDDDAKINVPWVPIDVGDNYANEEKLEQALTCETIIVPQPSVQNTITNENPNINGSKLGTAALLGAGAAAAVGGVILAKNDKEKKEEKLNNEYVKTSDEFGNFYSS